MAGDLRLRPGTERSIGPARVAVLAEEEFAAGAAERLAGLLRAAAAADAAAAGAPESRPVALMLAGGSTPRPVYGTLATAPGLPWERIQVYFGDERAVPPDHPESNFRMASAALLQRVPVPPAHVHRMEAEREDLDAAAAAYAALLPDRIDLLLLGLGADGHIASLFPNSSAIREGERKVVSTRAPSPPHARLSVTPGVIRSASRRAVLVTGSRKRTAVRRSLVESGDADECPGRIARDALWILDEGAAADLP